MQSQNDILNSHAHKTLVRLLHNACGLRDGVDYSVETTALGSVNFHCEFESAFEISRMIRRVQYPGNTSVTVGEFPLYNHTNWCG